MPIEDTVDEQSMLSKKEIKLFKQNPIHRVKNIQRPFCII